MIVHLCMEENNNPDMYISIDNERSPPHNLFLLFCGTFLLQLACWHSRNVGSINSLNDATRVLLRTHETMRNTIYQAITFESFIFLIISAIINT